MAKNKSNKKEFPPFKPLAYFGGNLLLGGLSYILLRQYKRFFILLGLLIVTSFIPLVSYAIVIGSAFDAKSISKKLKNKQIPEPQYNKILTWVALAVWVIMIILIIINITLLINGKSV